MRETNNATVTSNERLPLLVEHSSERQAVPLVRAQSERTDWVRRDVRRGGQEKLLKRNKSATPWRRPSRRSQDSGARTTGRSVAGTAEPVPSSLSLKEQHELDKEYDL